MIGTPHVGQKYLGDGISGATHLVELVVRLLPETHFVDYVPL
jgi:hypothetical protein